MALAQTDIKIYKEPIVTEHNTHVLGECGMGEIEFIDHRLSNVPYLGSIGAFTIGELNGQELNTGEKKYMSRTFTMSRVSYHGQIRVSIDQHYLPGRRYSASGYEWLNMNFSNLRRVEMNPHANRWDAGSPTDSAEEKLKNMLRKVLHGTSYPWHTQSNPSKVARAYVDKMKARLEMVINSEMQSLTEGLRAGVPLTQDGATAFLAQIHSDLTHSVSMSFEKAFGEHTGSDKEFLRHSNLGALEIRQEIRSAIESFMGVGGDS